MMRTTLLMLAAAAAFGQSIERMSNGVQFRVPAGWQSRAAEQHILLVPPDMVLQPEPQEAYILAAAPQAVDLSNAAFRESALKSFQGSGSVLTAFSGVQSFTAAGVRGQTCTLDFVAEGQTGRAVLYSLPVGAGGVLLVAAGRRDLVDRRTAIIDAVALSLRVPAAPAATTARPAEDRSDVARAWTGRLANSKLKQFSGYTSGTSGGTTSEKTITLFADGRFTYYAASSTSVYVPGMSGGGVSEDRDAGQWRVVSRGGQAIIVFSSQNGQTSEFTLSQRGGAIFLNDARWLPVRD